MKAVIASVSLLALLTPVVARPVSDSEARKAIIQESFASYPGPCPCPYGEATLFNRSMLIRADIATGPVGPV
jgi:hypothetical protein